MQYLVRTPWWLKRLYPAYSWDVPVSGKEVFLSFDDGPHERATPFVLEQLARYQAKASFFCIGKNVVQHPDLYRRLLEEGHAVGNHTFHHLNGWKTPDETYLADIRRAAEVIDSNLFRPPYGRIRRRQARQVAEAMKTTKGRVVMWDVLSADFDQSITPQRCLDNVVRNVRPGSIVVFHDSEKAFPNLEYSLPRALDYLQRNGFALKKLPG